MKGRAPARMAAVLFLWAAGCATAGRGTTPPLPGEPAVTDDEGGATTTDDGGSASDDGGAADPGAGGTCSDPLHVLKAFFVQAPMSCTSSSDCPSGDCCAVSGSASACVMQ